MPSPLISIPLLLSLIMKLDSVSTYTVPYHYSYQLSPETNQQQDSAQVVLPSTTANLFQHQPQQPAQFFKPEVKLPHGILRGSWIRLDSSERAFLAFLGIPYAAPPVGPLRFKSPRPHSGWMGQVLECSSFRSPCPQYDARGGILGHEDCLYLNVYLPGSVANSVKQQQKYPVMVFIQGESFENGDSAIYGPERLIDADVIVVTFNYRIGILGFASTGDEIISGNMGLKDQYMALEWVNQNIQHFQGDSSKVTIFGQGSGAASVMYHILSPRHLSGQLFQRAIAQSGSALCPWALERDPNQYLQSIAQQTGCMPPAPYNVAQMSSIWSNTGLEGQRAAYMSDLFDRLQNSSTLPKEYKQQQFDMILNSFIADCLRVAPLDQLLQAQTRTKILSQFPQRNAPVIELKQVPDAMIVEEPRRTLSQGTFNHVPLIMGLNKNEGSFFYPAIVNTYNVQQSSIVGAKSLDTLESDLVNRLLESATDFKSLYPINLIMATGSRRNSILNGTTLRAYNEARNQVQQTVQYSYFQSIDHYNLTQVAIKFINMTSDALYGSCMDETLKLYSRHGLGRTSTYMYVFDYLGQNSMVNLITRNSPLLFDTGVCHGDELFYLFSINSDDVKPLSIYDKRMSERLTRLWTDFARYGAPAYDNYEYPRWQNFDSGSLAYMRIGNYLLPDRSYKQAEAHFWSSHLYNVYEEAKAKLNASQTSASSASGDHHERISTYSQQPPTTATTTTTREVETFTPYQSHYRPPGDSGSAGYGTIIGKLASIQPGESMGQRNTSVTFLDMDRPLMRHMSSQIEQNRLREQQVIISSFAYTMVGTSISLLIIVVILLIVLYRQRRRHTFKTTSPSIWLEASNPMGSHYFHYPTTSSSDHHQHHANTSGSASSSVRPNPLMLY